MIPKQIAVLLCSALGVTATPQRGYPGPYPSPPSSPTCDSKWKYIGQDLKGHFIDHQGLCTGFARQCIRLPFHDCFPDGGCDGSIILSDECTTRRENAQIIPMCGVLGKIAQQYNVGAADLINFAACKCSACISSP